MKYSIKFLALALMFVTTAAHAEKVKLHCQALYEGESVDKTVEVTTDGLYYRTAGLVSTSRYCGATTIYVGFNDKNQLALSAANSQGCSVTDTWNEDIALFDQLKSIDTKVTYLNSALEVTCSVVK